MWHQFRSAAGHLYNLGSFGSMSMMRGFSSTCTRAKQLRPVPSLLPFSACPRVPRSGIGIDCCWWELQWGQEARSCIHAALTSPSSCILLPPSCSVGNVWAQLETAMLCYGSSLPYPGMGMSPLFPWTGKSGSMSHIWLMGHMLPTPDLEL